MADGILVPQPRIEPVFPALQGRFVTAGPQGIPLLPKLGLISWDHVLWWLSRLSCYLNHRHAPCLQAGFHRHRNNLTRAVPWHQESRAPVSCSSRPGQGLHEAGEGVTNSTLAGRLLEMQRRFLPPIMWQLTHLWEMSKRLSDEEYKAVMSPFDTHRILSSKWFLPKAWNSRVKDHSVFTSGSSWVSRQPWTLPSGSFWSSMRWEEWNQTRLSALSKLAEHGLGT